MQTMKPGSAPCFFHSFLHALAGLLLACAATPVIAATTVDSATVNGAVYSAATPYNATPSEVLSITINVTKSGGGNWRSYGATVGGAAWVTGTNCYNQTSPPNGTYGRSFTTVAPATAGTYDITFGTFTNNDCGGAGGSLTWTGAIVVAAPSSSTPTVVSINLASPDPTSPATLVDWTVTFSESVTGVDATDFALVEAGGATGASITGVSGGGTTWTVTANSGTGAGTLGLNLVDDDTIINAMLIPLGSAGAGNGNFTGQVYTVVYTASGFVFTDSVCTHGVSIGTGCNLVAWSPQIAGQNLAGVYITAVDTSGVPTRLHSSQDRTRDIEFGLSCHDPVANAGVQATFAGVTLPLCQANGATPVVWSAVVTVTFPGGSPSSSVSYTFNYADVGLVALWARNNAAPSETGTSGAFVVKPAGFVLSNIKCTTADAANCGAGALAMPTPGDNPGAANAAGVTFIRAGHPFTVTVTATTLDGVTATPNYGQETTPEGVMLASALVAPAGGSNPAVSGAFGAFSNGTATGTAFTWDEVGIVTLTPSVADANYLGAGDVIGTASGNVGRFFPDHFDTAVVATATLPMPCPTGLIPGCPILYPGFVYSGQPFSVRVTAKNLAGGTTTNYQGAFAKAVTLTAWDALGGATQNPGSGVLGSNAVAAAAFGSGAATLTDTPTYTFGTSPTAPTDIYQRATDTDNVTSLRATPADSVEGGVKIVSGRIKISNAHGSELLPLPMTASVQYYDGTYWTTSATDDVTSFDTTLSTSGGNLVATIISGLGGGVTVSSPGTAAIVGGVRTFRFAAPGVRGSANISLNAPAYLPSNTARATFGVYKGNNEFIYLRETY